MYGPSHFTIQTAQGLSRAEASLYGPSHFTIQTAQGLSQATHGLLGCAAGPGKALVGGALPGRQPLGETGGGRETAATHVGLGPRETERERRRDGERRRERERTRESRGPVGGRDRKTRSTQSAREKERDRGREAQRGRKGVPPGACRRLDLACCPCLLSVCR